MLIINSKIKTFFLMLSVFLLSCKYKGGECSQELLIQMDTVVDLGHIEFEKDVEFNFLVKNPTCKSIQVEYIQTSCGCMNIYPETNYLLSKDSLLFNAFYKPGVLGYVENDIFVYFKGYNLPAHFKNKCICI